MNKDFISIIIPLYNETEKVYELVQQTLKLSLKKEVIVIDDGSTFKNTVSVLSQIENKTPQVIIIRNSINQGKAFSVGKALKKTKGNIAVILDGDSELDPKDISHLYQALKKNNARLVSGIRVVKNREKLQTYTSLISRIAKKIVSLLIQILYKRKIKDVLSGYKMFYVSDLKNHTFISKRFGLETELVLDAVRKKRKIVEIDVSYYPRNYKEGKKINLVDGLEIIRVLFTLFSRRKIK